jgi:hypothetical protein
MGLCSCPPTNGRFPRYRRCAKSLILGISNRCLQLNFTRPNLDQIILFSEVDTIRGDQRVNIGQSNPLADPEASGGVICRPGTGVLRVALADAVRVDQ